MWRRSGGHRWVEGREPSRAPESGKEAHRNPYPDHPRRSSGVHGSHTGSVPAEPVDLVLAGGGARGAYEAGALSVLLPELERRGQRPSIVVGTSVGALNAAFAAASAHRPVEEALAKAVEMWETLHWRDVLAPLVSPRGLIRSLRYLGRLLWVKRPRIDSLLYTDP